MKKSCLLRTAHTKIHECLWSTPPCNLILQNDEAHVWRADLNLPAWQVRQLEQILSSDEKARAKRFHFEKHRRRFIVCRGFLRTILSRYSGIEPSEVEFSYGPYGKPELAFNNSTRVLRFNLSHSSEMALYAIACDRLVGIDLEHIRPNLDAEKLAKRFFFPLEFAEINSLPSDLKQEAFYKHWNLKEAYLKATGEGLAGLDHVEISKCGMNIVTFPNFQGITPKNSDWSTYQMKPSNGCTAALVLEGAGWNLIRFWDIR